MKEEYELVEHIYKDASMGAYTITKLLDDLKEKDNKIKGYAEEILQQYEDFSHEAKGQLKENNIPQWKKELLLR